MNYVVELHKPSTTLVRELFNFHNSSSYTAEQLYADGPPAVLSDGLYNTSQRMIVNDPTLGPILPWATIKYNRIDIATLFSVVEVKLREVDIKADGSIDHALVLGEIQRKYGLDQSEGKFIIQESGEQRWLVATADNPAFIGQSPLVIELSLDSRISLKVLNGFYALLGPFGPGGTDITFGDAELGFINAVSASDLITGTQLAQKLGLTAGSPIYENNETPWIKYTWKGKICFVAQKPIRRSVSYNDLLAYKAAGPDGRIITIGEDVYRVRLMGGIGDPDGAFTRGGLDDPATHGSEWNQVMYRISGYGTRTSEEPFDPWLSLTYDELPTAGYNHVEGDVNNHPYDAFFRGAPPSRATDIGYNGSAGKGVIHVDYVWRPVLEIVDKALIWQAADITRARPTFMYQVGAVDASATDPDVNAVMSPYNQVAYVDGLLNPTGIPTGDLGLMAVPCQPEGLYCDSVVTPTVTTLENDSPSHQLHVIAPTTITYTYYQPTAELLVSDSIPYLPAVPGRSQGDLVTPSHFGTTAMDDVDTVSRPYHPVVQASFYQPVNLTLVANTDDELTQVATLDSVNSGFLNHPTELTYVSNEDTP